MNRRTIAGVALVSVLALAGCSGGGSEGAPEGSTETQELNIGMTLDVTSFSPQEAADGYAIPYYQLPYDTLIRHTADGEYVPMLAQEWSYDEDQTALTLTLEEGIEFDDGTPLDAEAVKANLEASRDGTGIMSAQLASVESVEAVDETTVVLNLVAPDPALLWNLSSPGGSIGNPTKIGTDEMVTVPDGTGPYVYDQAASNIGAEYVFTKRDDYWDADTLDLPYDTITLTPLTEAAARVNALLAGEVDGAPIDQTTVAQVEGSGKQVVQYPASGVFGFFITDHDGTMVPALADVEVRQAINMAFDRATMLANLRGGYGLTTEQVFNAQGDVWDESINDTYGYDPVTAKQMIVDAGYPDGFSIDMPLLAFPEADILTQAFADVGITINWETLASQEVFPQILSGKYPMFLFQLQSTDPWQAIQFFISPEATWNTSHQSNPELDAMIEKAQYATSDEERTATYREINEWLVDNAWFAPMYFSDNLYGASTDVDVTAPYQQPVPSIYDYAPAA
ncbi:ABC transporter substrate-binding protein [Microbacterium sp. R86528]|uniref:ABC transporter substrate-binding protein n=1 Tax=Microbacterium sp. R86528 TaxID=3093864 RepID=UPI0037CC1E9C